MGHSWTAYAYDINTNTKLAELEPAGLSFDRQLNNAGACQFTLNLQTGHNRAAAAPLINMGGLPFKVYIDLDGEIEWGGICWTTSYTKSTGIYQINGAQFFSWLAQRLQAADYSATTYPDGIDPAVLFATFLADAQSTAKSGPGASIGMQVKGGTSQLGKYVPGYPLTQESTLSQIATDIIDMSLPGVGGIDFSEDSQWVAGVPVDTFTISSPRAGRSSEVSGLIFDLDTVTDYTWPTDATVMGTTIVATGSGTGTAIIAATAQAPGQPVGGLGQSPRLDKLINYTSVTSQAQISAAATGSAAQWGTPGVTPTITVPLFDARGNSKLGTWETGDDARIFTSGDDYFQNGYDKFWRIVQHSVNVPDSGTPTVTLTFNEPPVI